MDDKMLARELMKEFLEEIEPEDRHLKCPFYAPYSSEQLHGLCAIVFPGWGRKHLADRKKAGFRYGAAKLCPCGTMSKSYIRRKARRFAKNGRKNK